MYRGIGPRQGRASRKILEEDLAKDRPSSSAAATKRRSTSSQNRVTSSNTYLLRQLRKMKALSHSFTLRYHTVAIWHFLIRKCRPRRQSRDTITHLRTNKRFTIRFHCDVYHYFHPIITAPLRVRITTSISSIFNLF